MTPQEFEARYQLLRPLDGEAHRTHLARSRSGAIVMVHFVDGKPSEWADGRLGRLDTLDPARREKIIDVIDDDHKGAVVTRFLMDFHSFEEWMGVGAGGSASASAGVADAGTIVPPPPSVTSEPAGPAGGDSELPPTVGAFPALGTSFPPIGTPAVPSADSATPPAGPGEFTQAFLAASAGAPSGGLYEDEARPVEPAPESPIDAAAPESGTEPSIPPLADGVAEVPGQPASAESAPIDAPETETMGEFTREFRASLIRETPDPVVTTADPAPDGYPPPRSDEPALPTAGAADAVEEAGPIGASGAIQAEDVSVESMGEFTRAFRASLVPEPMAPGTDKCPAETPDGSTALPVDEPAPPTEAAEPASESMGEFTRAFRAWQPGADVADLEAASTAGQPVDETAPPREVGEFTANFRALDLPATPAEPVAASSIPPSPSAPEDGGIQLPPEPSGTAAPPPPDTMGDFTRMFLAQRPAEEPTTPESESVAEASPAEGAGTSQPATGAVGEFTSAFLAQTGPAPTAEPPSDRLADAPSEPAASDPAASEQAGEFTRMFQAQQPPVAGSSPSSPADAAPPAATEPDGPGEFTRMFQAARPAEPTDAPASPPRAPEVTATAPPADHEAGEFTRAFRGFVPADGPARPAEPTVTPPPAPSASESAGVPGEFTQMFRAAAPQEQGAAPPPPPPAPPAASPTTSQPADQPGEFTRAMRSLSDPRDTPPPTVATPIQSAPPPPPPPSAKGEFTTMFEKLAGAPPPPPPATPAYGSGLASSDPIWPADQSLTEDRYRDRLFNAPAPPPRAYQPPPVAGQVPGGVIPVDPELPPLPAEMVPQTPAQSQVGGEYTRMISSFAPPPVPPSTPPAGAPPAAGGPMPGAGLARAAVGKANSEVQSRLPKPVLYLGFGAIGLSALALILYLVLKSMLMSGPASTPPADAETAAEPAAAESSAPR